MSIAIDKIILSSNDNPKYLDFWPIVSRAYNKILGIPVHLAFLTDRNENDSLITRLRDTGEVTLFRPIEEISHANQAKMARHYLASTQENLVCYIDDIDLLPLNREFIVDKVADRPKDHLLCVGAEFWPYGNNGCFPISQITAEGYIFKQLINPNNLSFGELLKTWKGINVLHPTKEDIYNTLHSEDGGCFSDEYLIRYLRSVNKVNEFHKTRGFDWETQTVDRAFWDRFSQDKLDSHQYIYAHCVRPYSDFSKEIQPLIDYVEKTF